MKKLILTSCWLVGSLLELHSQENYKGKPLIHATQENADIAVAGNWNYGAWRISPQVANDTFSMVIFSGKEDFAFRTDKDSIRFKVKKGETVSFYVKLKDKEPAHTLVTGVPFTPVIANYNDRPENTTIRIVYEAKGHSYFDSLRLLYPVAQLLSKDGSDMERVLTIMNWTHHQWKHDGGNSPKGNDGISILNEAKAGGRFPCFAYSIVLRDQLVAQGYKARVVYIKTKDAETRRGSPGHVVTEVYLNDMKKWCFIDGQFNAMPTLNGTPLNGIEFQRAINENYDQFVIASRDPIQKRAYVDFVYDYLYHFDTKLDNRIRPGSRNTLDGKTSVMLVPVGAPELRKIAFWNSTVDYCVYTHSAADFYATPE